MPALGAQMGGGTLISKYKKANLEWEWEWEWEWEHTIPIPILIPISRRLSASSVLA